MPCDINAIYKSLKSTFSGLQFRRWQCESIFICLADIASETREMSRNSQRIWPYSSSRSSKVTVGVSGKRICDFLLFIVTLAVSATVSEIFTLKDRKLLILPTLNLFEDAPARGNSLEFLDETYPAKTRGMGLPYGEDFIILTLTVFYDTPVWQTDGQTNRQTDGR